MLCKEYKNNKLAMAINTFIFFILLFSLINVSYATNITVEGGTVQEIQQAIDSAEEGDIILLKNKTYYGSKKTIVINKNNIKILGISHNQPTIIDGLKSTGFADINANNTHFANIKFINFVKTSGNNGAVINSKNSHNLSIKNCYFHNNVVHNGAALFLKTLQLKYMILLF